MTKEDKILFELFGDIKAIVSLSSDYPKLNELVEDARSILAKKSYSNINALDAKGNTFIHYALAEGMFSWAHTLVSLGANPLIKNHDNRNAFQMIKTYEGRSTFLKPYYSIMRAKEFIEKTAPYSLEFKQLLLNEVNTTLLSLDSIEKIVSFLKAVNLDSTLNQTSLLMGNTMLGPVHQRAKIFLSSIEPTSSEANALFLLKVSQEYVTYNNALTSFTTTAKLINSSDFFSRKIEINNNFHTSLYFAINAVDDKYKLEKSKIVYETFLSNILTYAIDNNYDFKAKNCAVGQEKVSVSEIILEHQSVSQIIFNKLMLTKELVKKDIALTRSLEDPIKSSSRKNPALFKL